MTHRTCVNHTCTEPAAGLGKYCGTHSPRRSRLMSLEQRIQERVAVASEDECWPWTGYRTRSGYGVLRYKDQNVSAHRAFYEMHRGPIQPGLVLDHICHNKACVNPNHLRPVTNKQNIENFGAPVRSSNTTGHRGVWLHSSGLYAATVTHEGVVHRAGYFKSAEDAAEAARELRLSLHTHNDRDRSQRDGSVSDGHRADH